MPLTVRFLNEMFRMWGEKIDKPLETYLLALYEDELFSNIPEEEMYNQIRELMYQYAQGTLDITVPNVKQPISFRYEGLQTDYLELLNQNCRLHDIIQRFENPRKD